MKHIIALLALAMVTTAGFTPGRGHLSVAVYPESYGALGDASTDNTTAIQAAIDAAEAAGGGTVQFGVGEYRFTSALTIDGNGVILQGVSGHTNVPSANEGTTLRFQPSAADSTPDGIIIENCQGVTIRDMVLSAPTGGAGNFIIMDDVEFCSMENVRVLFAAGEEAGISAISLISTSGSGTTANWFYAVHVLASGGAGSSGREGTGVRLECTSGFVTDNQFTMCKFSNFENPGGAILMEGGTCTVASNRFTSCHIGTPGDGVDAAIDLNAADLNIFMPVTIDGDGTDSVFDLDANSDNNLFIGTIDGNYTDNNTDPNEMLVIFDTGSTGSEDFAVPWITTHRRGSAPANTTDGTMFIGSRDGGGADTLFARLDGAWVVVSP